ncbi:DUF4402 domain-containing protein [Sphingorhabdus lutea]|nr:DUF4402 domain-containing protein [Sphingorhabdus lutea]
MAATPAFAAQESGNAGAEVINPISVTAANDISFGTFVANTASVGYVTIEPENIRSQCSVASCTGLFSPSTFNVTGEPGQAVNVSHIGDSLNPVTFQLTDGTNIITFGLILHTPVLTLDAAGAGSFNIGARLRIPANTPAGNYSGNYWVQVEYQ